MLRRAGASTASDAFDALGLTAAVAELRPVATRAAVAGPVVTTRLGQEERPRGPHLGTRAIDAAAPGSVVVVASGGITHAGSWGGLLTRAAVAKGLAGAVVDGAARDVDEAAALGFPVFAWATTVRSARGRLFEHSFNEPVEVGSARVEPGDWVVADATGVVFIAAAQLDAVVAKVNELMAREAAIADALTRGVAAQEALGRNYEEMLRPQ